MFTKISKLVEAQPNVRVVHVMVYCFVDVLPLLCGVLSLLNHKISVYDTNVYLAEVKPMNIYTNHGWNIA